MKHEPAAVDLSIVVPAFDEEDNLDRLVAELRQALENEGLVTEIILVDDGSRDGTGAKITALAAAHREVRGLHFRRNSGQTAAMDAGFKAARGRWVVTIDADLQNDPADIPKLLEALEGHDAAVGYRATREDNWLRRLSSRFANAVRNRLSGDDIIDTGCTLKAFRRECLNDFTLYHGMHRFLPTLLRMNGRDVVQVPVGHRRRVHGDSKYGVWNRALPAFVDLLAVRWMKKRNLNYEVERHDD